MWITEKIILLAWAHMISAKSLKTLAESNYRDLHPNSFHEDVCKILEGNKKWLLSSLHDVYDHDYFHAVETIHIKWSYGNLNYLCFPITKTHHFRFWYKDA